ncbi:hypothetical protein R6Z07F_014344 [Ovis aries]
MDSPLRCPVRGKTRSKECDYVVLGEEGFPQSTIFSSIWISMASQVPCTAPQAATVLLLKTQYKARSKDWSKLTQQAWNKCSFGPCEQTVTQLYDSHTSHFQWLSTAWAWHGPDHLFSSAGKLAPGHVWED